MAASDFPNTVPSAVESQPMPEAPSCTTADDHLKNLVRLEAEEPWLKAFVRNIRETLQPEKLAPLVVTSKPVPVRDIWGKSENRGRAGVTSLAIHVGVVTLMLVVSFTPAGEGMRQEVTKLVAPIFIPDLAPQAQQMGGGGGGGDRSPTPPPKAKLPKQELRQFTPPVAEIKNPEPKLIAEPSIIVPPEIKLPEVASINLGDPLSQITGPPTAGPGALGGLGSGRGGGVGSGEGGGFGPGRGGGVGGGAYRVGGGVSSPQIIHKVEPEYSEEARKAKFQGTVVLYIEVDEKGQPMNLRVIRPLGLGLDEKAIEAVKQWRFRPGLKDGKPVRVAAQIEVNFRLL
jgi:periplasmic protein TonB